MKHALQWPSMSTSNCVASVHKIITILIEAFANEKLYKVDIYDHVGVWKLKLSFETDNQFGICIVLIIRLR